MYIKLLIKSLLMTKEKYYSFVEDTKVECINDIHSFIYKDVLPSSQIMEDMFCVQPFHAKIESLYNLTQTAGGGTTFNKATRIMQWLSDNTFYSGMTFKRRKDDPVSILRSSYSKGFRGALNCRHKAFAYVDCLLAVGIRAFPLCLLRPHKYNGIPSVGCHFMVQVFLPEQNKWIITDPSFNTYFEDGQGRLLDYFDLIECAKNNSYIIKGYNFNGDSKRCFDIYKAAFVQATMQYIGIWENNSRKNRRADPTYYLISPEGYDLNAELKQFISGWTPLPYRAINPSDITKI